MKSKILGLHCPYKGHFKHLVVCALECPLPGGNSKCQLYREVPHEDIKECVDEYQLKQASVVHKFEETPKTKEKTVTTTPKAPPEELMVLSMFGMSRIVSATQLREMPTIVTDGSVPIYLFKLGERLNVQDVVGAKGQLQSKPIVEASDISTADTAAPTGADGQKRRGRPPIQPPGTGTTSDVPKHANKKGDAGLAADASKGAATEPSASQPTRGKSAQTNPTARGVFGDIVPFVPKKS